MDPIVSAEAIVPISTVPPSNQPAVNTDTSMDMRTPSWMPD